MRLSTADFVINEIQEITRRLKMCQQSIDEPPHDKKQQNDFAPSEDSDQPGYPPSLFRVFAARLMDS